MRRERIARLSRHDNEARGVEISEIEDHPEASAVPIEIRLLGALDEKSAAIERIGTAIRFGRQRQQTAQDGNAREERMWKGGGMGAAPAPSGHVGSEIGRELVDRVVQ